MARNKSTSERVPNKREEVLVRAERRTMSIGVRIATVN